MGTMRPSPALSDYATSLHLTVLLREMPPLDSLPLGLVVRYLRLCTGVMYGDSLRSIQGQLDTFEAEAERLLRPPARPPRSDRPRCGARTRKGEPCCAPVVWPKGYRPEKRCRTHGGLSTGPKTAEGRERIAESNRRRAAARLKAG
jgi:hypothetical protein